VTDPPYVFDGHNDLPWAMRELCGYELDQADLLAGEPRLQTDLPRLRRGRVGAQFWSVYVPCRLVGDSAVTATLEQIDFVKRLVARYDDRLSLATTAADVDLAVESGRVASLLGMEGGHSIGGSLGTLRMMYELGVRYLTLTHNENVPWADHAAADRGALGWVRLPTDGGTRHPAGPGWVRLPTDGGTRHPAGLGRVRLPTDGGTRPSVGATPRQTSTPTSTGSPPTSRSIRQPDPRRTNVDDH